MEPLREGPKHREEKPAGFASSFTRAALFTWGVALGFTFGFLYTLACLAAATVS